jgi:hypothetical protein
VSPEQLRQVEAERAFMAQLQEQWVQDVQNVIAEHMNHLDHMWPDSEPHGPHKVNIVELIDAIKLRLIQRAEKNASRYESPFERAARKITGTPSPKAATMPKQEESPTNTKSAMQLAFEASRDRMRKSTT